jgi:hypothetical protein
MKSVRAAVHDASEQSMRKWGRLSAALVAGTVAIAINMLVLKAADFISLATARGGLLRLLQHWLSGPLHGLGISGAWNGLGGLAPSSPLFQACFHIFVGLLLALFYAFVLEPLFAIRSWVKGLLYALAVWIVNAVVVLPATAEGFAGAAHLTLPGMIWFAVAHTVFFVLLAAVYSNLRSRY